MTPAPVIRDPIAFELFKNALIAIADEMALTITRTTYSGVLKDNMDFSTAFCDGDGRLVAQGLTLPGHLGSLPTALKATLDRFGDDINEGDVLCLNDPYAGGMHLPDLFVFKPIFHNGRRLAFAATICHHTDVGGRVAGSNAADSTEIYQEGLRIPPSKLYVRGAPNETLFDLIRTNVRLPVQVEADIRAQMAACHIAERQFIEIIEDAGADETLQLIDELIDYSERLARSAIAALPDGEWSFEDWIDDDGVDLGKPIRLFVTFRKQGERIEADWTGSNPQVRGAINNTFSYTQAASYCAVRCVLDADIPMNEGFFRTIDVTAPLGTIANMQLPGACAARGLTGFRMIDCALGALAMMRPDKVMAASDGGNTGISIGGWTPELKPFVYVDFTCGAWGARPWADGLAGNANIFSNMASQSVEITEAEHPVEILRYEFLADKAGAGLYRGGAPFGRDYRITAENASLQVRADRAAFRPYGLYGGSAGHFAKNTLNPGTETERALSPKFTMDVVKGDVFRHELAGPGGWGDPLDRPPEAVLEDVRDSLVSEAGARRDYCVVIAHDAIDEAASLTLRAERRKQRGPAPTPFTRELAS
ncbi:MAG: hydantoinase B/oxoprolinase family protein [Alphaproteobacteria bacterium]